jgi:large subunit ribosomal protein L15
MARNALAEERPAVKEKTGMLTLNTIRAQKGATKKRKRLGRGSGSGHGPTAGKGDKGQLQRSGGSVRPGFEGGQMPLYRRLPKRGFNNVHRRTQAVLNVGELDKLDASIKEITLETLQQAGQVKGRYDRLTILGTGDVTRAFTVRAHRVSPSAQEKISKAGGKVELIQIPGKKPQANKKAAAQA